MNKLSGAHHYLELPDGGREPSGTIALYVRLQQLAVDDDATIMIR